MHGAVRGVSLGSFRTHSDIPIHQETRDRELIKRQHNGFVKCSSAAFGGSCGYDVCLKFPYDDDDEFIKVENLSAGMMMMMSGISGWRKR